MRIGGESSTIVSVTPNYSIFDILNVKSKYRWKLIGSTLPFYGWFYVCHTSVALPLFCTSTVYKNSDKVSHGFGKFCQESRFEHTVFSVPYYLTSSVLFSLVSNSRDVQWRDRVLILILQKDLRFQRESTLPFWIVSAPSDMHV